MLIKLENNYNQALQGLFLTVILGIYFNSASWGNLVATDL